VSVSFVKINIETAIMLLIFNFLFVSFTFQLSGTRMQKLGLLAVGNVLGLLCNFLFISLSTASSEYFGTGSNVFYAIFYPIVNTLWIVMFWSLSLSTLPKPSNVKAEAVN
jgi:hypothetical protein